jgi:lactoylglutathione lyase
MNPPSVSLGYVILCVKDVGASLEFYERAFGLKRRFFNDDDGKAYGELDTGAACLAFASLEMARANLGQDVAAASLGKQPQAVEIALVTADVHGLYARAVGAGATKLCEPEVKPWGQTVGYVRDQDGHLVEICTPVG